MIYADYLVITADSLEECVRRGIRGKNATLCRMK